MYIRKQSTKTSWSDPHPYELFWHIFFWHTIWKSLWHIYIYIFWHSIWHLFSHSVWNCLRHFPLLAFSLCGFRPSPPRLELAISSRWEEEARRRRGRKMSCNFVKIERPSPRGWVKKKVQICTTWIVQCTDCTMYKWHWI